MGTGVDDRNVTGVGFQPAFAWVKSDSGSQAVMRPSSVAGDLSFQWNGTVGAVDKLQALQADGFQVGSNAQVNTSAATYHYLAIQDSVPVPTSTPTYTPTATPTNTSTFTATNTPTDTATFTATFTPTNTFTPTPTSSPMRVATGSFLGNAADDRAITGVGFRPDLVIAKCDCGQNAVIRTSTMIGDASKDPNLGAALAPDYIQSLDADGFTVGTSNKVNNSGKTIYWVAMKAGDELHLGTYVGDGTDNRSITGFGFQPAFVLTMADGNESVFRPASVAGDSSFRVAGSSSLANRIQAILADGFQVGSDQDVNLAGTAYHYVLWKASANITQSSYVGDGVDGRSVTGVGFQPAFVWIKESIGSSSAFRPASASGDLSFNWGNSAGATNKIKALQPDGFQVGTNAQVNSSSSTYNYTAFKDSVATPTATP
ncbi:MAG: DUF7483 domain-containing protein, partial [bacterium]